MSAEFFWDLLQCGEEEMYYVNLPFYRYDILLAKGKIRLLLSQPHFAVQYDELNNPTNWLTQEEFEKCLAQLQKPNEHAVALLTIRNSPDWFPNVSHQQDKLSLDTGCLVLNPTVGSTKT